MNFILGILSVVIGICLINYYQILKKQNKTGGLSFKLQSGGIGFVIIGIGLLLKEIF